MVSKSRNPMWVLVFYSALMVTLPITSFFITQFAVERFLDVSNSRSYIYATAVSVIVVHIILGLFVYYAYKDDKVDPVKED